MGYKKYQIISIFVTTSSKIKMYGYVYKSNKFYLFYFFFHIWFKIQCEHFYNLIIYNENSVLETIYLKLSKIVNKFKISGYKKYYIITIFIYYNSKFNFFWNLNLSQVSKVIHLFMLLKLFNLIYMQGKRDLMNVFEI